jgi:hypothetical protein
LLASFKQTCIGTSHVLINDVLSLHVEAVSFD